MTAPIPMLEARGLCKSFAALTVVSEVSLKLERGERHGLIGPNGAGKTTLFNLLSGESAVDAGTVWMDGADITRLPPEARAGAGLGRSFQQSSLFPEWTVLRNLAMACALQQRLCPVFWRSLAHIAAPWAAAERCAEAVGLAAAAQTPVEQLSHGARRQLEIGMSLAIAPRVLLLDEPTAGMGPAETAAIKALVRTLPAELTVLMIEHDLDVVFELAERITVLDYGKVLVRGTPAEVRASALVRERYLGKDEAP